MHEPTRCGLSSDNLVQTGAARLPAEYSFDLGVSGDELHRVASAPFADAHREIYIYWLIANQPGWLIPDRVALVNRHPRLLTMLTHSVSIFVCDQDVQVPRYRRLVRWGASGPFRQLCHRGNAKASDGTCRRAHRVFARATTEQVGETLWRSRRAMEYPRQRPVPRLFRLARRGSLGCRDRRLPLRSKDHGKA